MGITENLTNSADQTLYSIVICTKNRPYEIRTLLNNLSIQKSDSLHSVIVVDGSTDASNLSLFEIENQKLSQNQDVAVLRTSGGKPTALNIAMRYILSNNEFLGAVVFLDDDITFQLTDLEKGIKYLKENNICGLSPLIINEGDYCFRKKSKNRLSRIYGKPGTLTKAGDNPWINYKSIDEDWISTKWLPGGAAIFDWDKIKQLHFDESLENPQLMGYALGDDVDFSIKANRHGELGCLQSIHVIHSSPVSSFREPILIARAKGRWKAFLVCKYPDKFSRTQVVLLEILRNTGRGIFKAKPSASWLDLVNFLRSFFEYLKVQK